MFRTRGVHWRNYYSTNPRLYALAYERAADTYPKHYDPEDAPAEIECYFGSRHTALTLGVVDAKAVNLYGWGYCTLLALAIHELTDLPLALFTKRFVEGTHDWTGHATVQLPDGQHLDITGVRTKESIQKEYRITAEPEILTREQFCAIVASGEHQENPFSFVDELEQLLTFEFARLVLKHAKVPVKELVR